MKIIRRPAAMAALMALALGPAAAAGLDKARIDAALSGFIDSHALVGVSALVYEGDREAYFGAFGAADREAGKPMTRDTLVQIFSMTKPLTGVALMSLYEAGKFRLDDPVARYAPEFANLRVYAGIDPHGEVIYETLRRPVTIRDLTRHTAGFYAGMDHTPLGEIYRAANPTDKGNTLVQEARKLGSVPLLFQPGTRWLYGPSVDVQALLVERLSGMPFDKYLETVIFKPLGMNNTRYVLRPQDRPRMAAMYEWHEDGSLTREPDDEALEFNSRDWPLKPGSFGLVSTLDDYMRFARMLQNGGEINGKRLLKAETVRLMATDAMPAKSRTHPGCPPRARWVSASTSPYAFVRLPMRRRHPAPWANSFGMARPTPCSGWIRATGSPPCCSPSIGRSARCPCTRRFGTRCTPQSPRPGRGAADAHVHAPRIHRAGCRSRGSAVHQHHRHSRTGRRIPKTAGLCAVRPRQPQHPSAGPGAAKDQSLPPGRHHYGYAGKGGQMAGAVRHREFEHL